MGRIALLLAVCLALSGCGGRELHQRLLIQTLAVDVTGEGYILTAWAQGETASGTGDTLPAALEDLGLAAGREPFLGQADDLVLGRAAGEESLSQVLEFAVGNCRPTVGLWVAPGLASRAGELPAGVEAPDLLEFSNALARGEAACLPLAAGEGQAVFQGEGLAQALPGREQ